MSFVAPHLAFTPGRACISLLYFVFLAGAFSETQKAAERTVNTRRVAQWEAGVGVGQTAAWTMEETGIFVDARVQAIMHTMNWLREAVLASV